MNSKKIVVFDTGTGGRIFADHLRHQLPTTEIITVIDADHSPYGDRSPSEIFNFTYHAILPFIDQVSAIVLACNTATAICIDRLRAMHKSQLFVGFEPMLKPAAQLTQTGKIAVLATTATKASDRYKMLKETYASGVTVLEPDTSTWATKIDTGTIRPTDIVLPLSPIIKDSPDIITLACTHYISIENQIKNLFPSSQILHPTDNVTTYIKLKLHLDQ